MHTFSRKRVQINRQRRRQRFTFTSAHLRDLIAMERQTTNQLDIIVTLLECTLCCLANDGKHFIRQIIQCLTIGKTFLELVRLRFELLIGKLLDPRLEHIDRVCFF